jgi:V/A-type H+/Na+-transporting ATPase subunit I
VPVVLRNRAWARPFQRLLGLVPLPRYGSLDPTPWLAVFFPLFMGFVLGDLALGAAGAVAAGVVWRRAPPGSLRRDAAWIALACALSAAVFGVLFGEALGELGAHAGLRPLVLDRRRALLTFLGVALAVGGLHVATGMILGVVGAARARAARGDRARGEAGPAGLGGARAGRPRGDAPAPAPDAGAGGLRRRPRRGGLGRWPLAALDLLLYALYARGRDVRRMAAIVGAAGLGDEEKRLLVFADRFEAELVGQGGTFRTIEDTLELGWRLLAAFPPAALTRIPERLLAARTPQGGAA